MSFISVTNLHKTYDQHALKTKVLRGVNIEIAKSEFVSIVGPSGSGKSTLLNILGMLDTLDSGMYLLNGMVVSTMQDDELTRFRLKNTGMVFQDFNLIQSVNVHENVALPMVYNGINSNVRKTRVNELLDQFGIGDKAKKYPYQLSGGQQQRVAIARALANKPEVLFADEPTGNLDTTTSQSVMEIFQKLHSDGMTIIMVTHDMGLARRAQRLITVQDGHIIDSSMQTVSQVQQNVPGELVMPRINTEQDATEASKPSTNGVGKLT